MNRALRVAILAAGVCVPLLDAADFASYRGFDFGSDVAAVAKHAGMKPSDAIVIHLQPAVMQEMEWRPRSTMQEEPNKADPVKEAVLSFLDGKLYRIVVTYDRYKIEGMTEQDMIDAISQSYGLVSRPGVEIPFSSNYAEIAKVLARWQDADYAYDLVRTGDQSSFAFVLYNKSAQARAQTVAAQALRLEALDAPRKALEEERRRGEEERLLQERTRSLNKPNFRP